MAKNIQEHLEMIKSQRAPWDEADVTKRIARLGSWFDKVAKLSSVGGKVHQAPTHNRPHVDELVAYFQGAKYPSELFGNMSGIISLNDLEDFERPFGQGLILRTDSGPYLGKDPYLNWQSNIRQFGTGGGVLDEHVTRNEKRIEGESCTTLMARLLGIVEKEEIRRLLVAVREHDTKGINISLIQELVGIVKNGYRDIDWDQVSIGDEKDKQNQLLIIRKALIWLNKFTEREARTIEEFNRVGRIRKIDEQGTLLVGRAKTNNPFMADYIKDRFGTAVNIIKSKDGHTVVLMNNKFIPFEVMNELTEVIRREEAQINGRKLPRDASVYQSEGFIDCAPEWYFVHGKMLLNGSESNPTGVDPTRITLLRLEDIAAQVLSAKADRIREWKKGEKEKKSEHYKQQAQGKK